jgi:adenine-specific DNA-methyltransferase
MYPRLRLARNLLREDGAIFVSIDDNEAHHLKMIMNEIFGEENFVAQIVWQKSKKGDAKLIAQTHEYVLVYTRNKDQVIKNGIWRIRKQGVDEVLQQYEHFLKEYNYEHALVSEAMRKWYKNLPKEHIARNHKHYNNSDDRGLYFAADFAGPDDGRTSRPRYDIRHPITGEPCKKPSTGWRWDEERTISALAENPPRIHFGLDETTIPCRKSYLFEIDSEPFASVFYRDGRGATSEVESLIGPGIFDFPKSKETLFDFFDLVTDSNDIVLDFFAGSGTTAQAVIEHNIFTNSSKRFLCIQIPQLTEIDSRAFKSGFKNIAEISKERIRKSIFKLKDSLVNKNDNQNLSFKVLKLNKSHFKPWEDITTSNTGQIQLQFQESVNTLVEKWTLEGLMTETILLEGFPLDSKITCEENLTQNIVNRVSSDFCEHELLICLDDAIQPETIQNLNLRESDIFICLDSSITDEIKLSLSDKGMIKTI